MHNDKSASYESHHDSEEPPCVSKYRAVVFVSAVLAYVIYAADKNCLFDNSWLNVDASAILHFSCFNDQNKLKLGCNIALSVLVLAVFLLLLRMCLLRQARLNPSAEELADCANAHNRRGFVRRISPQEFSA